MKKRVKISTQSSCGEIRREQRLTCLMSEEELQIVDRYLEKYNITNRSRWLRETVLSFIHKKMEEDYPTLFGEHDMRR
ncbi:MAG: hypothetical protein LIP08_11985 [Bacteroides sp.]|nr:hypothetical protein [Bacteroides sp.]